MTWVFNLFTDYLLPAIIIVISIAIVVVIIITIIIINVNSIIFIVMINSNNVIIGSFTYLFVLIVIIHSLMLTHRASMARMQNIHFKSYSLSTLDKVSNFFFFF